MAIVGCSVALGAARILHPTTATTPTARATAIGAARLRPAASHLREVRGHRVLWLRDRYGAKFGGPSRARRLVRERQERRAELDDIAISKRGLARHRA